MKRNVQACGQYYTFQTEYSENFHKNIRSFQKYFINFYESIKNKFDMIGCLIHFEFDGGISSLQLEGSDRIIG